MRAYKWLEPGRLEPSRDLVWPEPNAEAGEWIAMRGQLGDTSFALVATALAAAATTTDLWEVELGGPVRQRDGRLFAEQGRLVRPVVEWTERLAHEHLRDCLVIGQRLVVRVLTALSRHAGEGPDGEIIASGRDLQQAIADERLRVTSAKAIEVIATRPEDAVADGARRAVELFEKLPTTIGSAAQFGLARTTAGSVCRVTGLLARLTVGVEAMAARSAADGTPDPTVARDAETSVIADIDHALARRLGLPIG